MVPGSEAHRLYRQALGIASGDTDAPREIHDADGLTHVEDEQIPIAADRRRIDINQAASGMVTGERARTLRQLQARRDGDAKTVSGAAPSC
jgi:hypothetical protein